MLNPVTTESLWSAIRRIERQVAELARRTGTTTTPTATASASSSARVAEPAPDTGPGPVASVVPLLPPGIAPGPDGDGWRTVAESVTPATPWLTLHARVPVVVPPGGRDAGRILARLTVDGAEVWRGPLDALRGPPDAYAVVGPVAVPDGLVDPLSGRHVRVQITAAPPPGTGPAWLVWQHAG